MDSTSFSYLQLLMDINTPRWSHYTRQLQTYSGYYSSSLKSSGHWNSTNKNKWEQQNTDSYFSYLEMVMDVNTPRWNHCTRQMKTNGAYFSSSMKSSGHRNPKTENPETNPPKIPSLLDVVIPMPHNVSPNLSTCKRQFKQKQRECHAVSSKPEKENKKTVVSKLNAHKTTILCGPETPRSNTDRLKHTSAANELKLTRTDVSVHEIENTISTAVSQLIDRLTSEVRSTLGTTTDQRITLCSGTVTHEQSALSEQDRNAFSTADALLNNENVQERFAAMSIESSGVNNDHPGHINTEMVPESHPLQQSELLRGQVPRKSRMARFLGPIPFRQWLYIVDTNNHHDNIIKNSSSFRQCGDLQHDTHNDRSLPDSRRVSESIDGPLTPEAYSSKDDTFVWTWPPAPVPKSQTREEIGTLLDPLPELEITLSEFVETIEGTYKEPVIAGIEEYVTVQQRVPCRIPTDCYWMSRATDQITRPCCKTESLLMDVTRELVESTKFRQ